MQLYEYNLFELRQALDKKEITSQDVTRSLLDRIQAVNPSVNGYITVCEEEAIAAAAAADAALQADSHALLCGIPGAIKDNICTDGILTTCASKILYNFRPPYNASVMEALNAQQFVMLGKANMDEFAMGSSTETSYFGDTCNPYDLTRIPGGSSGGSAAIVAAGMAPFALGSDTGGSVRQPAALCGVVGMKPTYGLVSRYGLIAFASSLDQIGPITRNVRDCAAVLSVIAGYDSKDSTSLHTPSTDYVEQLSGDVKGLKIGLPREYFGEGVSPIIRDTVRQAAHTFEQMGAVVEECSLPFTDYALAAYYLISSAEASSNLARYDGVRYGFRSPADSYEEMFEKTRSEGFGDEVKRRIMLGAFVLSAGYYDAYYKKAQQVRKLIVDDFSRLFQRYDFLLTPASPVVAWPRGEKTGMMEMAAADICTVSVNIAGLPALSMPCGRDAQGLPIGMQLIGKPQDDALLLRAGHAYELQTQLGFDRPVLAGGNA